MQNLLVQLISKPYPERKFMKTENTRQLRKMISLFKF